MAFIGIVMGYLKHGASHLDLQAAPRPVAGCDPVKAATGSKKPADVGELRAKRRNPMHIVTTLLMDQILQQKSRAIYTVLKALRCWYGNCNSRTRSPEA